jgi:osmotically-inducible protein OsmY
MRSDTQLQHDVIEELEWEPSIDSSKIGVAAKDGVITLMGSAPRYSEKIEAERLVKSIAGVRAVANDIEVRLPGASERNDTDIAMAAVNALKWHTSIPSEKLKVTVRNGWVTLDGEVGWQFQRQAAHDAVAYLIGVKGVTDQIVLAARPKAKDIKERIQAAFKRNAEIDAQRVRVDAMGGTIKLHGNVASWSEYSEAERIAWAAPGVTAVENDLSVGIGST